MHMCKQCILHADAGFSGATSASPEESRDLLARKSRNITSSINCSLNLIITSSIIYTLWLFNIAMENGPFIDDFPVKASIYKGFSKAMLNNQMVVTPINDYQWGNCITSFGFHWLCRQTLCPSPWRFSIAMFDFQRVRSLAWLGIAWSFSEALDLWDIVLVGPQWLSYVELA